MVLKLNDQMALKRRSLFSKTNEKSLGSQKYPRNLFGNRPVQSSKMNQKDMDWMEKSTIQSMKETENLISFQNIQSNSKNNRLPATILNSGHNSPVLLLHLFTQNNTTLRKVARLSLEFFGVLFSVSSRSYQRKPFN